MLLQIDQKKAKEIVSKVNSLLPSMKTSFTIPELVQILKENKCKYYRKTASVIRDLKLNTDGYNIGANNISYPKYSTKDDKPIYWVDFHKHFNNYMPSNKTNIEINQQNLSKSMSEHVGLLIKNRHKNKTPRIPLVTKIDVLKEAVDFLFENDACYGGKELRRSFRELKCSYASMLVSVMSKMNILYKKPSSSKYSIYQRYYPLPLEISEEINKQIYLDYQKYLVGQKGEILDNDANINKNELTEEEPSIKKALKNHPLFQQKINDIPENEPIASIKREDIINGEFTKSEVIRILENYYSKHSADDDDWTLFSLFESIAFAQELRNRGYEVTATKIVSL